MSEDRTAYLPCRVLTMPQGSHEWHQARLGIPTASNIAKIITPLGKPTTSAARRRYTLDLAVERITKRPTETPCTFAMQRGKDMEPLARMWYYCQTRTPVTEVGFCVTLDGLTGCSPDGLVGDDGAIEIKCPGIAHYCEIVASGEIPDDWLLQCHHALYVTGRAWIDFVLFTDVEPFDGWIKRVDRDTVMCGKIHAAIQDFADEVGWTYKKIVHGAKLTPDKLDFPVPVLTEGGEVNMEGIEL